MCEDLRPALRALVDALAQGKQELHTALAELEKTLANALPDDTGAVRLDSDDKLVIPKLTAEDVPAEAKELKDELAGMLPFAPIASLLIELDVRTAFLDCFTHAGGRKQVHSADLKRNILAVLIAMATNLGLARMSEACGVSYDVLAWTAEWYVREETLREANTVIVNHHHCLELAKVFGGGTMSSSDGQRFPVRGKTLTGREAQYVLDDFLGNATDLPIHEHATDTHGVTLKLDLSVLQQLLAPLLLPGPLPHQRPPLCRGPGYADVLLSVIDVGVSRVGTSA